jgi:hypothetical protein
MRALRAWLSPLVERVENNSSAAPWTLGVVRVWCGGFRADLRRFTGLFWGRYCVARASRFGGSWPELRRRFALPLHAVP